MSYDGYALIPKFKVSTKANFSLEKVKQLCTKEIEILPKSGILILMI